MATSTSSEVNVLEKLDELRQQVGDLEQEAQQALAAFQQKMDERNKALGQIGELCQQASSQPHDASLVNGARSSSTPTVRGPQPSGKPASAKANQRPNQKSNQNTRVQKKGVQKRVGRGGRPASGQSLKATIWDVLVKAMTDRKFVKQFISDYPNDAVGLKVAEMKEIIEQSGSWSTTSSSFATQIQNHVHDLYKKQGKLGRSEDRRYWIIEGAELDGPSLDGNGNPIG